MKKTLAALTTLAGLLIALNVQAEPAYNIVVKNNFSKPLTFSLYANRNADVTPDFKTPFTVEPSNQVSSRVVDTGHECYWEVDDIGGSRPVKNTAFWGVNVENHKMKIHGYTARGIAYSWSGNVVTFCSPEDYAKKKSC